jgi:hypothetical protein
MLCWMTRYARCCNGYWMQGCIHMVSWAWAMIAHHVDMMAAGIIVTLCIAGCLNTDTPCAKT